MVVLLFFTCLLTLADLSLQQPPGVPPRQSNQPPHGQPQQYQQQQQQHGGEAHDHGQHGKPLEFASEVHNADHILEHLEKVVATKPKEQMTEEELEFHYFKMHDYDNNNKLDGVEIAKALTHFHDENDSPDAATRYHYSDEELAEVIDSALRSDDLDGDGYVEFPEFMTAQARIRQERSSTQGMPPGHQEKEPQPDNGSKPPGF